VSDAPLWIREAEVVRVLDLPAAIDVLETALVAEAEGGVRPLEKTHASFSGGDLHALGAVVADPASAGRGLAGTKTWAHTRGGAMPLLALWRVADGALVAVIEAFALGQLRTSGISAVATARLAQPDASELAVIGTGKQALGQVAAVAAVRALRGVRVFSPTPEHRAAFAARVERELGVAARAAASVGECVRGAAVVTTVTRATEPFLESAVLERGAHVNAVGAIAPDRAEIAPDVFARVGLAVADSPAQAMHLSRELRLAYGGERRDGASPLVPLCEVVSGRAVRPPDADLTLFKAMGIGLADVALGRAIVDAAHRLGLGRAIEPPERVAPRLVARDAARGREGGKP
jgi:ornithine cyclodeaminase